MKKYSMPIYKVCLCILLMIFIGALFLIMFNNIWGKPLEGVGRLYAPILIGLFLMRWLIQMLLSFVLRIDKSQKIKFRFSLKKFGIYCSSSGNYTVRRFAIIVIMPLMLLGIIPLILSLSFGWYLILELSVFMNAIFVADIIMFLWILKAPKYYFAYSDMENKAITLTIHE